MTTGKRSETYWIELGFLPVDVGYVPTAKAWRRTLKELGITDEPFPETDGRCVHWTNVGAIRKDIVLITVGARANKFSMSQVVGIIAHECAHAWRHIREAMAETEPSAEFEAYVMQCLVQHAVFAHAERRKKPWKT